MAKKDTKAAPAKTVKSAGVRSPGSKPTANRRPVKTAPDAASSETVQMNVSGSGESRGNSRGDLSPEEVYRLIQETAYYKAKARGFAPGHEVQDWIEAEAEVRLRLESRV